MVLLNTNIDFTSPSGGILQDIDHIEFIPSGQGFLPDGDSPNLPSGGLWLRPNDGQVERLNYQGTSGIFGARNAEGCAVYTTDQLQGFGGGAVGFETVVLEDSQFINQESSGTFKIQIQGLWRVTYAASFLSTEAGSRGTMRGTLTQVAPVRTNFVSTICENFVATPGDQGGGCVYANCVVLFPRGAIVGLQVLALGGAQTTLVEAMLTFELIRPDSETI